MTTSACGSAASVDVSSLTQTSVPTAISTRTATPIPSTPTHAPAVRSTLISESLPVTPAQALPTKKSTSLSNNLIIVFTVDAENGYIYYAVNGDGTNLVQLAQSYDDPYLSLSFNGKRIAYVYDYRRIAILNTDGTGRLEPKTKGDIIESPALSPDGEWVAYMSDLEGRHNINVQWRDFDIVVSRIDGLSSSILVQNKYNNKFPAWSPDGTEIAYLTEAFVDGKLVVTANIITVADRQIRKIQEFHGGWSRGLSWSPDGRYLAVVTEKDIYIILSNGKGTVQWIESIDPLSDAAWMPDSRHLVFAEFICESRCNHVLKVADLVTGNVALFETAAIGVLDTRQVRAVRWSLPVKNTNIPDCSSGWSRLQIGGYAIVSPGDSNRLRSEPSKTAEVIGQLSPGTVVKILEGPVCADGLVFWKVENSTIPSSSGWTAEGDGKEYWLEPYK